MKPRPLILVGILASMVSGVGMGIIGYRAWLQPAILPDYALTFEQVLEEVHDNYVDEIPRERLVNGALRGMLRELDPHSSFLDTTDWDELQSETAGEFSGIGVEIGVVREQVTIIAPISDSPAADAGLLAGDQILAVDGTQPIPGDLGDVIRRLRGEPGSSVTLLIGRPAVTAPMEIQLERALIRTRSVAARLLEPGYGYVRISQFQIQTGAEFSQALADLAQSSARPLQGLVLDLRDNPGGVLQTSVEVADALLSEGLIVYTEGRKPASHIRFQADRDDLLNGAPVVVLINRGSASAAEVVAGALQDNARAVVIGSQSYGKGSVQSLLQISTREAIKLTTARYFTPKGRNIDHTGITPDILRDPLQQPEQTDDGELIADALAVLKGQSTGLQARR